MLDFKVQYLIDHKEDYIKELVRRMEAALVTYGKADPTISIYADILFSTIELAFLGDSLRLELYKKLVELLRKAGVVIRIPQPVRASSDYSTTFYGSGAPGLTPTQIEQLSSGYVKLSNDISLVFNPTSEVMYFAYPDSFSTMNSISDANGFNVTAGWTMRVETLIVNGQPVPYKVYESDNLTALTGYSITFKV